MSKDIDIKLLEKYCIYDNPFPFKDLLIHPVLIKDYIHFQTAINCMLINKNRIPDPKVITMSYLDFIFHMASQDEESQAYIYMLVELLKICFKVDSDNLKYVKTKDGKINLIINDSIIDKKDFANIRQIICYQNGVDLPDENIDPKLEKALHEMAEYQNKNQSKPCSIEDQIICLLISTALSMDDIKNLTIRKFNKAIERIDKKMHYEIFITAKMGGMVEFKEEIDHWMSEIKPIDKFKDMVQLDAFKDKINSVK